eukprot:PhF_6_TR31442/c0_g1_i1/m.46133
MLDGREKVGTVQVNYAELALTKPFTRKEIPINPSDPSDIVYIREMSIARGALGCATWDGGVVLARWIRRAGAGILTGKKVLELGGGVGIGGIVAARYADVVVITDYLPDVIENAKYNVKVNVEEELVDNVSVGYIDWHQCLPKSSTSNSTTTTAGDGEEQPQPLHRCTKTDSGPRFSVQKWYRCPACFGTDPSAGVCEECYEGCHKHHEGSSYAETSNFRCDCTEPHAQDNMSLAPKSFDVIIGSELTYSLLSCDALAATVDHYLAPGGVFYEVLSEDRDGVSYFCDLMEKRGGFVMSKHRVPEVDTSAGFKTRQWSKQGQEKYCYFTWKRVGSEMPDMQ